jgi:thioredoxin
MVLTATVGVAASDHCRTIDPTIAENPLESLMPIIVCPDCGARNRVEARGPGLKPVCGRCGRALPMTDAGKPLDVSDATFAVEVLGAGPQPVLVDCWAPWCGPCRALAPTLDRLAAEAAGRWRVVKLNVDENPVIAARFAIQSIPTLLIFKSGALVDRLLGLQPAAAIEAALRAHG